MRCGILPLRVETCRYIGQKREDRKCELCNLNEVEDEIHFVLKCPFYYQERHLFKQSLDKYCNLTLLSETVQLQNLCSLEPRKLSTFLLIIIKKRHDYLYSNVNVLV